MQVIGPYKVMKKFTEKLGGMFQAHHIFEKSKMINMGLDPDVGPAVLLTDAEHKAITAKLAAATKSVEPKTPDELWKLYKDVYKDHPHWLSAIKHFFEDVK